VSDNYSVELIAPDISSYRDGNTGIDYVTTFDSGKAGPHVMISAVTHGNELCGAITLDYLFQQNVRPISGKLSFAFNNYRAFLDFDPKYPLISRFVDQDFNRLWSPDILDSEQTSSELERARQSFAQVTNLFPDHLKVSDALYKLGVVYHRLGDNARALQYLNRVRQQHPASSAAGLAETYAAELQ